MIRVASPYKHGVGAIFARVSAPRVNGNEANVPALAPVHSHAAPSTAAIAQGGETLGQHGSASLKAHMTAPVMVYKLPERPRI